MDNAFYLPFFVGRQIFSQTRDKKQWFALEIIILPYYDTISEQFLMNLSPVLIYV